MPKWSVPWTFPIVLAVAVGLVAIFQAVGGIALIVMCFVGLPILRYWYLKKHPPNPELVHKPFWRL